MVIRRIVGSVRNPAQIVVGGFVLLIALGTLLLRLPISIDPGVAHPGWQDSLFSSTSATTVTGLVTVDVSDFSLFGELVLLALIQLGGFGIMTVGSVLALVTLRRFGLRQRMLAQAEIGAVDLGELRYLVSAIAKITLVVEASIALILWAPMASNGLDAGPAAYNAVFHAVSAFNNAGISLYSDNLTQFAGDPFVVFPISAAFIVGGLGFPVLVELRRRATPWRLSLHARITLAVTAVLLVVAPVSVLAFEWYNPATLGPMDVWDKLQAAWFQGATPRTAGFSTIDTGAQREPTLLVTIGLMFIGAGPASTGGGIKVTTFAVLSVALWAQVRGDADVDVFRRRVPSPVVRQAMAVALSSIGVVFCTSIALSAMSSFAFIDTLFESVSAFATVGLSTGITGSLPSAGRLLLVVVMVVGRVGPITFVAALALRQRSRAYRFAAERPIIG